MIKISQKEFRKEVLDSVTPVLVKFTTEWCVPCKIMLPILAQIEKEFGSSTKFVEMDAEESPEIASRYEVMSVPTLILFEKSQPVSRLSGYQPKNKILDAFFGVSR